MSKMKPMKQIYEEEIEQRDYTRNLLHQHLQYHSADVDRLNELISDYTYRIGGYRRLLKELQERKAQHDQDR